MLPPLDDPSVFVPPSKAARPPSRAAGQRTQRSVPSSRSASRARGLRRHSRTRVLAPAFGTRRAQSDGPDSPSGRYHQSLWPLPRPARPWSQTPQPLYGSHESLPGPRPGPPQPRPLCGPGPGPGPLSSPPSRAPPRPLVHCRRRSCAAAAAIASPWA